MNSTSTDVWVKCNDVYVRLNIRPLNSTQEIAKLWKNGQLIAVSERGKKYDATGSKDQVYVVELSNFNLE